MLEVKTVTRSYGARQALAGVSLEVRPGEIVGLLGANGAGKSTLLRTAAGLQTPDEGCVRVAGHDVWEAPLEARARLGYAAEEPAFHEELSAAEYLSFLAAVRGLEPVPAQARARALAGAFDLDQRMDDPVRDFSHGMRKKLSFLAAVLHRPAVLLCDEALEGFDAPSALAAKAELRARAREGCAVLFSSHVTETVERLCDRVVMLRLGRIALEMTRAQWGAGSEEHSPLERAFLGVVSGSHPS